MKPPSYFALIPAAGVGTRMGAGLPKQYLPLAGRPMLLHALETLAATPAIEHVYVVVSPDDAHIDAVLAGAGLAPQRASVLRAGGNTRQDTVRQALAVLRPRIADQDWVLVHDAARPGLSVAMVEGLMAALAEDEIGGLLALPVVDTLKRARAGRVEATVARDGLWAAQTPQMFRYALLRRALEQGEGMTDEASAVEALGLQPRLVPGSARNFKVTLPQDMALAELYLQHLKEKYA